MAKGAATETALGSLHAQVAAVFNKVLSTYEKRLDTLDQLNTEDITEEVLATLLDDGAMPNPAMLSAITKFLKDNEINFDSQEIASLSSQERRLADRRANRQGMASLTSLSVVQSG
jgi:hypothetical protein